MADMSSRFRHLRQKGQIGNVPPLPMEIEIEFVIDPAFILFSPCTPALPNREILACDDRSNGILYKCQYPKVRKGGKYLRYGNLRFTEWCTKEQTILLLIRRNGW
jgi:hypothetical protein